MKAISASAIGVVATALLLTPLLLEYSHKATEEETVVKQEGFSLCTSEIVKGRIHWWQWQCETMFRQHNAELESLLEQRSPLYDAICTIREVRDALNVSALEGGKTLFPEECRAWYKKQGNDDLHLPLEICNLPQEEVNGINEEYEKGVRRCELILR